MVQHIKVAPQLFFISTRIKNFKLYKKFIFSIFIKKKKKKKREKLGLFRRVLFFKVFLGILRGVAT